MGRTPPPARDLSVMLESQQIIQQLLGANCPTSLLELPYIACPTVVVVAARSSFKHLREAWTCSNRVGWQ